MAAEDSTDSPASTDHRSRRFPATREGEYPVNRGFPRNCGHASAGASPLPQLARAAEGKRQRAKGKSKKSLLPNALGSASPALGPSSFAFRLSVSTPTHKPPAPPRR